MSLLATPMFHVGGLGWALVGLHRGARTIIVGSDPADRARGPAASERVTHAFLVPDAAAGLCDIAGSDGGSPIFSVVVYGAAPMSAATRTAVWRPSTAPWCTCTA